MSKGVTAEEGRIGLRVRQLVPVRLGRRLPQPPGLLLGGAVDRQGQHGALRVGLLDGRQAGREGHQGAGRHAAREGRRGARRRLLRRAHGRVACWNAVMDENDYMVRKWNEFIAA